MHHFAFRASSHDSRCGSGDLCFPETFCLAGVCMCVCLNLSFFVWMLSSFPVVIVLYLCFCFVSNFGHVACVFAWVHSGRTSSGARSHASYSIQQLLCKMLIWKSKCGVYVRVNKRLRATVCSCGYWDMAQFGIWHFLRLHMVILFAVCVPETPSLFATVYRTLHFLS